MLRNYDSLSLSLSHRLRVKSTEGRKEGSKVCAIKPGLADETTRHYTSGCTVPEALPIIRWGWGWDFLPESRAVYAFQVQYTSSFVILTSVLQAPPSQGARVHKLDTTHKRSRSELAVRHD